MLNKSLNSRVLVLILIISCGAVALVIHTCNVLNSMSSDSTIKDSTDNTVTKIIDTVVDNPVVIDSNDSESIVKEKPKTLHTLTVIKKGNKKPVVKREINRKAIPEKPKREENKNTFACYCFDFTSPAVKKADALKCAQYHWKKADSLLLNNPDKAFTHTKRALDLYENGSLFYQKAFQLHGLKRFNEALLAADICMARSDHWNKNDPVKALRLKIVTLEALMNIHPSLTLQSQLKEAKYALQTYSL